MNALNKVSPKNDHTLLRLTDQDFEEILERPLSKFVKQKIKNAQFKYRNLTSNKRDLVLKKIVDTLLDPNIVNSGKHRKKQWEKGWGENLELYKKNQDEENVLPKYHGKFPILRFKQQFIEAVSEKFEYHTLSIIVYWLFDKYFRKNFSVYEFGCGTGHHLLRLREINSHATLYGLDWANSSVKLINQIAKKRTDNNLKAKFFDFFKPDNSFKLGKNAAVYTVAALEQVGTNYQPFTQYLLKNKPSICIHVEPIAELLDPENNLLDYLSVQYFKKRNYLLGFLNYLKKLEQAKKITIHQAKRTFIGSLYIEGYSVIVWSPVS